MIRYYNKKLTNGELHEGEYYVEFKDGRQTTMYLGNDEPTRRSVRCKHLRILAPVPSYQWVIEHTFKSFSQRTFEKTLVKNQELKDLLREWLLFSVEENPKDFTVMSERLEELEKRTREVLND